MKRLVPIFLVLAATSPVAAQAPQTLDDLLKQVRGGAKSDNAMLQKREAEFAAQKNKQQQLLKAAQAERAALEKTGASLERQFEQNEKAIAELEGTLRTRLGTMGELFGVIRQVAGDTRSHLESSIVSAQHPDRHKALEVLSESKRLPAVQELEELWYAMQHEMTESGKVVRFNTSIIEAAGSEKEASVVRVGTFNAVADGAYLRWLPEVGKLAMLDRQPAARYLDTAGDLQEAKSGLTRFAIDPSRGSLLALLVQTPGIVERLQFGGIIGYVIISLGFIALLVALYRLVYVSRAGMAVRKQQGTEEPGTDNPLGRVLSVYANNKELDTETLELKMDEAILREQGQLERFMWLIKVVSVVAPLMGLLGTVTGMIRTFQSITLFGTGDPKLMAGGISEALVTTMLGLIVAIPLVLLHSWIRSITKRLVEILGEQSVGMVAEQAEKQR